MPEHTISLLFVDEDSADAELIINVLRNSGMAVRAKRIEDDEDFIAALGEQRWDIIVTKHKLTYFSASQLMEELKKSEKDIPVIVVTRGNEDISVTETLRTGAIAQLPLGELDHLQLVITREFENVTVRRALNSCKKAYQEAERRSRGLIDSSRDAIAYVHEGMHIYANTVYLEMFGFADQEEIEGIPIMDMVAPNDHARFKEFLRSFLNTDEELQGEIEVKGLSADSSTFDAQMEFTPATMEGESCTQIIIRQASSLELEKQLKQLSQQDLLTGLYNRTFFIDELDQAVIRAAADGETSSALYVGIDDFADIKSRLGMAESDLILGDVADLIKNHTEEPDIAARLEGHIFTILLKKTDIQDAVKQAKKLQHLISDHIFAVGKQSVTLTCSIGLCPVTETSDSSEVVLSRIDHAYHTASDEGNSSLHVYTVQEDREAGIELSEVWITRINSALERDGFRLVYQPIVSIHGDPNESYEVFMRMVGDDNELIMPSQYLNTAEKAGLMTKIDRWIIAHALGVLADKRASGSPTQLYIKLSADSILDKSLLPWLSEQLKGRRLAGDSVGFEISEPTAMMHLTQAKTLVNGLKQLRCHVVLEHFGSGLNSFNALKHLNVDYLKIDGQLIKDLSSNEQNQVTVKSITEMAHSKGKLTIAEAVQDANSLAVLWQCGINYIQGHFLSEPGESLDFDFTAND